MSILEECDPATHPECVTQYSDFAIVCLCWTVLLVLLHSHCFRHGSSAVPDDENRLMKMEFLLFYYFLFPPGDFDTLHIGK